MKTPSRFRENERRNARIGRPLRLLGRVGPVDEELMARLGRGFTERDEPARRLADAIRLRAGHPDRVGMGQVRAALDGELGADLAGAPPVLADLIRSAATPPDWVDFDLVEEGAALFRRLGTNAADVLTQLSLIGGYRFGGPADLLVATGGLSGATTLRRLAETQKWTTSLSAPGALRPYGEGWRLTVHVRLMHAMVAATLEPRWDVERWGLPLNQTDLAGTLGLFDGTVVVGCRALGVRITAREAHAYLHLWRWVGHLLGVHPDFLTDDERERARINYHVLLAQSGVTPAGPQLSKAILEVQGDRDFGGPFPALRARFERERMLSMLTAFLGPASMRDLELPIRPPWAFGYVVPLNLVRYRLLGRTSAGRRLLIAWGDRNAERTLASYFKGSEHGVGALPVGQP